MTLSQFSLSLTHTYTPSFQPWITAHLTLILKMIHFSITEMTVWNELCNQYHTFVNSSSSPGNHFFFFFFTSCSNNLCPVKTNGGAPRLTMCLQGQFSCLQIKLPYTGMCVYWYSFWISKEWKEDVKFINKGIPALFYVHIWLFVISM